MSYSFTTTESSTFTVTHARHMAAKVATDLKRMQRLYGSPTDAEITAYESEITDLLKGGYLDTVSYGFKRDDQWVEPTLQYTARELSGTAANDDDPGRVRPGANIVGASFYSYLIYSNVWDLLSESDRDTIRRRLPVTRSGAPRPTVNGHLTNDLTYSSGGRALARASVRSA
jgi:hypothetical protein